MAAIQIQKIASGNPFEDHPQLMSIWPDPYRRIAIEAITLDLSVQTEFDIGGIFLIKKNDTVIGITGYFHWDSDAEKKESIGLRWHGIVPDHRGEHISKHVIDQVLQSATKEHPGIHTLIELIPINDYGNQFRPHFLTMGFDISGEPQQFDWADCQWQELHLKVRPFLNKSSPKNMIP